MTFRKLAGVAASIAGAAMIATSASAGPDDDSLVIAWGSTGPIENVDNYFNTNRTGIWFSRMVWDQLIYREPKTFEYKPLLATRLGAAERHDLAVQAARGRQVP